MTENEKLRQVTAARWLRQHGFYQSDHRIYYQTAQGNTVKITPANQERWLADLNQRFRREFPTFTPHIPTADEMAARWAPEGIAIALKKALEDKARRQRDVAGLLTMAGRYLP